MSEQFFEHVILTIMGVAGVLDFCGTLRLPHPWTARKGVFIGVVGALIFLWKALGAFSSLSSASSVELFGFIGCMLGILGSTRIISEALDRLAAATRTYPAR